MIARTDSIRRVRSIEVIHSAAQDESSDENGPHRSLATAKNWVENNPTAAVAICAAVGLVIGFLIKRRRN